MIGYSLMEREYHEILPYKPGGIRLPHNPVNTLTSVKARHKRWEHAHMFGPTDWLDVTSQASIYNKRGITLLHGMYGEYDEVDVTYMAGLQTMPDDVASAIDEISDLLLRREITEWNAFLPDHVMAVIEKYRTKGGGKR
jgi:hypothetical protein